MIDGVSQLGMKPGRMSRETSDLGVREMQGYVGFANIPNQIHRKAIRSGFHLTLMAVGGSGLGKSTFLKSLFLSDLQPADSPAPKKTTHVTANQYLLVENGVELNLTLVDTPGFGDQLDNSRCVEPILGYVEGEFRAYLDAEMKVGRGEGLIEDRRVHVCLYFISPSGHGLRALDLTVMKELGDRVNLIPLIAKADTLTAAELRDFKQRIRDEMAVNSIKQYVFPENESIPYVDVPAKPTIGTPARSKMPKEVKEAPFAVVGSNTLVEVGGRKVRGRKYAWGIVEVENGEHNDFITLRDLLIRQHLVDLVEVTKHVHYENFRCRTLGNDGKSPPPSANPFSSLEAQRKKHAKKMERLEREMEQSLATKASDKELAIQELEQKFLSKQERAKKELAVTLHQLESLHAAIKDIQRQHPQIKSYASTNSLHHPTSNLAVPKSSPQGRRSWSGSTNTLEDSEHTKQSWISKHMHKKK